MDEAIAFVVSVQVAGNFAAKNVPEHGKSVVDCLGVDLLVQIFDEDVSGARTTNTWIALKAICIRKLYNFYQMKNLRPHDANWLVHQQVEVHGVECTFGYK